MAISQEFIRNRLLKVMPAEKFEALVPHLSEIGLPLRMTLDEPNKPSSDVVFLESGIASVVAITTDNEQAEIGHVGWEGMSGRHVLLSVDHTPHHTFMQVEGRGLKIDTSTFREILAADLTLKDFFLRYVFTIEMQLAHSAVANARYNMPERLARWLLMCHDRIGAPDLPVTHEFLALMLGVRRSGVTNEIHVLEGTRAIKATRANIRVRDRDKLLEIAGGCYGTPEAEYERLLKYF